MILRVTATDYFNGGIKEKFTVELKDSAMLFDLKYAIKKHFGRSYEDVAVQDPRQTRRMFLSGPDNMKMTQLVGKAGGNIKADVAKDCGRP